MYRWSCNVGRANNGMPVIDAVPPGYAFATIGAKSQIAEVEIDGDRLAPGGIVVLPDGPAKVQGVRPLLAGGIITTLELTLWERGEVPIAAARASAREAYAGSGVAIGWTPVLALPWDGRERGVLRVFGNVAIDYYVEARGCHEGGGGEFVAPYASGTYTPTALTSGKTSSLWLNIGGHGDLGERATEFHVYLNPSALATIRAELEAF